MTQFNPIINAQMSVPEDVPEAPTVHAPKADWADAAGTLLQGFGVLTENFAKQEAENERKALATAKEKKEQQKVTAGNELAREVLRANQRLSQTRNRTQYDIDIRKIKDTANAAGILDAGTINSIVNGTDEGNMDISLESRKRFVKADDDAIVQEVNEMRARYKSLENKSVSEVAMYKNKITNTYDFAIEMINRGSQVDATRYPELRAQYDRERDEFFRENTAGQLLLDVVNDLQTNSNFFADPAQVEKRKQQYIRQQVEKGVPNAEAIVNVDYVFKMTGAYDVYNDMQTELNLSKKDMTDIMEYRTTQEKFGMLQNNPELYSGMALMNTMGKEIYAEFSRQPEGIKFNKALAKNFAEIAKGNFEDLSKFDNKGQATNIVSKIFRGNFNPTFKASAGVGLLKDVNNVGSGLYKKSDNAKGIVLSNTRGVVARLDNAFVQATIDQMKRSNKENDRVIGAELEKEKQTAESREKGLAYIMGPNKGGQEFRNIANSIIADNLRVDMNGNLVYVAPKGMGETVGESIADWFMDYGDSIKTINEDAQAVLGIKGSDMEDMWLSLGVPMLDPSERALSEPSFSREKSLSQEWAEHRQALEGNDKRYQFLDTVLKRIDKQEMGEEEAQFVNKLKALKSASWWHNAENIRERTEEVVNDPMFKELSREAQQFIGGKLYTPLTAEQADAKLLREKADVLEESTRNLSPEAMREYGEGNRKTIEEARRKAKELDNKTVYGEATYSRSEPLGFAQLDYSNMEIGKLVKSKTESEEAMSKEVNKGTDEYDTKLGSYMEKEQYDAWLQSLKDQGFSTSTKDYDLRGAFLAGVELGENGHLPDTFKKPNHITFSKESKYYEDGMWAGEWTEDGDFMIPLVTSKAKLAKLKKYFAEHEPNAMIVINNPKVLQQLKDVEAEEDRISEALSTEEDMDISHAMQLEKEKEALMNKRHRLWKLVYIQP